MSADFEWIKSSTVLSQTEIHMRIGELNDFLNSNYV